MKNIDLKAEASVAQGSTDSMQTPELAKLSQFNEPLQVLLIEDSFNDAAFLQMLLDRKAKDRVFLTHATLLAEGLELIKQRDFDVVMLDMQLPDAQGAQAVNMINQLNTDIPIIILTGHDRNEVVNNAMRAGVAHYLQKWEGGTSVMRALDDVTSSDRPTKKK